MAAPKGNQFWKARSSHGRKPIFPAPDALWEACQEYFQWVEDNPLKEERPFAYKGDVTIATVDKMRAMTVTGLCLFLDISFEAWSQYRGREGFVEVCTRAEAVIYSQKFAGAAADLLNANIIARDLGLRDKQETTISGELDLNTLTDDQLESRIVELAAKTGIVPVVTGEGTPGEA